MSHRKKLKKRGPIHKFRPREINGLLENGVLCGETGAKAYPSTNSWLGVDCWECIKLGIKEALGEI